MKRLLFPLAASVAAVVLYKFLMSAPTEVPAKMEFPSPVEIQKAAPETRAVAVQSPVEQLSGQKLKSQISIPSRATVASDRYFRTKNLKDVVARAEENPAQGSYFHAIEALRSCASDLSLLMAAKQDSAAADKKRRATLERIEARCDALPYDRERQLGTDGSKAKDAMLQLYPAKGLGADAPATSRQQKLDALLTTADPVLANVLARELAVSAENSHWNNEQFTQIELSSLAAAYLLFACDVGVPCDDTHWLVVSACAGQGRCFNSLDELLRVGGADAMRLFNINAQRYSYDTAQALADRLRAASVGQHRLLLGGN
jgi:hypothetical protein